MTISFKFHFFKTKLDKKCKIADLKQYYFPY